jgi:hypothetical protein
MKKRFKRQKSSKYFFLNQKIERIHQLEYLKKIAVISVLIALILSVIGFFVLGRTTSTSTPTSTLPVPTKSDRAETLVSTSTKDREPPQPSNSKVGRPLSDEERRAIAAILGETSINNRAIAFEQTPKLILHDTSGELSDSTIEEKKQSAIGPLGNGINAYVTRAGKVILSRAFYDPRRPTATVYEKSADILTESQRDVEARRVWQTAAASVKQTALQNAVAGLNLNEAALMERATTWLNAPSDSAFKALEARSSTSLDGGKTTGLWATAQVCDRVVADKHNAISLASSPASSKTLKAACQKLHPLFQEKRKRVASSVHVEILQMRGSECYTTDAQVQNYNANVADGLHIAGDSLVPLQTWEHPAYTDAQYEKVALIYLFAALQANRYPEITTHFWVDQGKVGKIGTHCDPRGLNLTRLYQLISSALGHPPDTLYGIQPQYGLHPEKGDNVWWSEAILSELPPSENSFGS